jgi:hypothetical protein
VDDAGAADEFEATKCAYLAFAGHRYLGDFIGKREMRRAWIQERLKTWAEAVEELASAANPSLQTACFSNLPSSFLWRGHC